MRRWRMRAALDFRDWRSGDRDPLVPPRRKNMPSQITAVGEKMVQVMVDAGGLEPDSAVLDIGCGPGRIAAPLTRHLDSETGSYEGFDVMPKAVAWCSRRITRRHPNFRFQLADLHNAQYNPRGRQQASRYRFPYSDASFDVAVAGSLFTHLQPFEGQRYLEEAARVLKSGGRLIGTWFLINEEAEDLLARGMAKRPGVYPDTGPPLRFGYELTDESGARFRAEEEEVPEHRIALYEEDVKAQHERAGLRIVEIRLGRWPGRELPAQAPGQDIIVAERT
jgi:SAM-dependent methyltransferase